MGSYDFLASLPGNEDGFERLVNEIKENRCCAFVGAGLSADANYSPWDDLVKALKDRAEALSGKKIIFPTDSNPENIEIIKNILPEDEYWNIVFDIFGPREKHPYLPYQDKLCEIPWVTFVTTNYDYCIENASNKTQRILETQFIPELDISIKDKNFVYHIHGIVDASNRNISTLSAILSKSDYDRAYTPNTNLPRFLASLSEFYTLVFWGYGLRDKEINKIIHETQLEIDERTKFELKNGLGHRKQIKHFIIYHPESTVDVDVIKYLDLTPIILNENMDRRQALYRLLDTLITRTTSIVINSPTVHLGLLEA